MLDHDDGTFFGTMECQWFFTCQPLVSMVFPMVFSLGTMVFQWFLSLDHWYRWFFQWFFHKRWCFFNGFLPSDHWYRWFFQWFFHLRRWFLNGFLPLDHWYQWFFTVEPLVSMVFPMVSYSGNIGLNGLEKASDGHQWFTEKRLFIVNMAPVSEIWILLPAHDPLKVVAGWHHNIC